MQRILAGLLLAAVAFPAVAAERIISLGGSVTEILYALGQEEHIVAVDSTSLYPPAAQSLPNVGYLRQLSAEPILSLAPDLVLGTEDAGPKTTLEQIAAIGVPVALIEDQPTVAGVVAKIESVAAAIGQEEAGRALAEKTEAEFAAIAAVLEQSEERPGVLFLLSVADGGAMAAGGDTAADGLIALAGGSNVITGYNGYKPLSPEAAAQLDPAVVIVSAHGLDQFGGLEALAARPDLGLIPAVREGRVLVIDANLLLGFGPRAPEAVRTLAVALHPDFAADLAP